MSLIATLPVEHEEDRTIPEGVMLRAEIVEAEPSAYTFTDKDSGEKVERKKLVWVFRITDSGKYQGRKVRGDTVLPISDNPRAKTNLWITAATGRDLAPNSGFDTEDLIGLPVEVVITHEKDRKEPDKIWERVVSVQPISRVSFSDQPPF